MGRTKSLRDFLSVHTRSTQGLRGNGRLAIFWLMIFFPTFGFSDLALAQTNPDPNSFFGQQTTKIGGGLVIYGGEVDTSLTKRRAYGGEISTERGSRWIRVFGRVRGEYSNGQTSFLDPTTSTDYSYEFIFGQALLGVRLSLMPNKYFVPYIYGAGVGGLAHLSINGTPASLRKSQSSLATGSEIGAGLELEFGSQSGGGKKTLLYSEIQLRRGTVELAGRRDFSLESLRLVGGFGW